jgi:hypothetical protein
MDGPVTKISRLVINSPHPEAFLRGHGIDKDPWQQMMAIRERMIDAVMVYLFSHPTCSIALSERMLGYLACLVLAYFHLHLLTLYCST